MHKLFYASGFIYHLPSQQILLQQSQSIPSPWVLFEKEHTENEQPKVIFEDAIGNFLDITLDTINPIYSYFDETTNKNISLLYATVRSLQDFPPKGGFSFRWFFFKEVLKIQATQQTKHDIVVGQRVIEAAERKDRGEHTLQ